MPADAAAPVAAEATRATVKIEPRVALAAATALEEKASVGTGFRSSEVMAAASYLVGEAGCLEPGSRSGRWDDTMGDSQDLRGLHTHACERRERGSCLQPWW